MITEDNLVRFFSKGTRGISCRPVAIRREGDGFVYYGPLWKRRCAKRIWDNVLQSAMTPLEFRDSSLCIVDGHMDAWTKHGIRTPAPPPARKRSLVSQAKGWARRMWRRIGGYLAFK